MSISSSDWHINKSGFHYYTSLCVIADNCIGTTLVSDFKISTILRKELVQYYIPP